MSNRGAMNNKLVVLITIYGIFTFLTIVIFNLIINEKTLIDYLSLFFLLIAEIILFGGFYITKIRKHFYSSIGINTTVVIYFILAATGCIFNDVFGKNIKGFILYHITLIGILAVMNIIILIFTSKIERRENREIEYQNSQDYNKPKRGGF